MKLDRRNVVMYLSRNLVTVRILELPSTSPKEIGDMISLQIGKQTPYSKEEIVSSYKIIGSDKEGYTKVILVIARRNLIDERMEALLKSSIEAKEVTLSSEGVYSWFNVFYASKLNLGNSEAVILVDIDSNYSDFLVIHKKNLRFSKNILIGTNHLLEEKNTSLNEFIEGLKHSKEAFCEENRAFKVVKLFLSGAAKNIKDLDVALSAQLDLPCEILDIVKDAQYQAPGEVFFRESGLKFISLSPIFGILLKYNQLEFNLLPGEKRIHKLMEEKRKNLTIMGILFSAIMMMLSLLILIHIYNKNIYAAQLRQKSALIKSDSDEIEKMRLSVNLIQGLLDARGDSLNLLKEIYKIIPKEIYLTNIDIERRKQIVLRGCAQAMSDVFKFVTLLEKSPYFENVKNTYATAKKENNTERTDFEITFAYEQLRQR
jgi:Tfp pilus assembly protein PilN